MVNDQSLQEKIVRGGFVTLLLTLAGSIFAYLIRILYSHTLSIENYGLFYAIFGSTSFIAGFSDMGLGYATIYLLPKYLKIKNFSKAWNIFVYGQVASSLITAVIAFLLMISAPFLAKHYFKVAGSENLIYIFCIYFITLLILNGLTQIFTGMQKVKYYSSITVSKWFLTFTFSALFFLFDFPNIIFYAVAWALGHIVTAVIFLFLFLRKHSYLSKNKVTWESMLFKQMSVLAYPVFLEHLVITSVVLIEIFLLTLLKGVKDVGIYNVIYPLAAVPLMLLSPVNSVILPLVSHLMEGEKEKLRYLISRILEIAPFIGVYFSLFLIIFPTSIVGLIFGQKWLGLTETSLMVLSAGSIGFLMADILGTIVIGTGMIKARFRVNAFLAILTVILDVFLIQEYGVLGVVISNSVIKLTLSVWCLRAIKSSVSFRVPLWFYLKILIFSILIFSTVRIIGFSPKNWLELIISGIIYTGLFIILGLILKIYNKTLFLMIIPKKHNKT